MSLSCWIRCPDCGDYGPHTILVETTDPVVVYCVNEFCPGEEFKVARWEIEL